jgi:predicted MFS family arabinose efflux permease
MELSIFVAKTFAVIYFAAGIGAVTGTLELGKIVKEFEKSQTSSYMAGMFAIIIGMLLIEHHNIWAKDWTVLITLVGWIAAIKGAFLIIFPKIIGYFKGFYKNNRLWGLLMISISILFGYFGFLM